MRLLAANTQDPAKINYVLRLLATLIERRNARA